MAASEVQGGAIGESIALNARKYDAIPYTSKPLAQTHPVRLAGLARMFGLEAASMASARVLEIGCASGGNLIPHAATYPGAEFLGIDISERQVADANERIARIGQANVKVRCQSLTDFGPEEGQFDYIIAHGVHSWVPEEVQEALLRVCRQNLSPVGIAFISYNVLPGWRHWQALRDAFLLMIPKKHDEATRVAMARDLLEFMRDFTPGSGAHADVLRGSFDMLKGLPDDYIAHEYLEDANLPISFRDFVTQAGRHGLAYLGESDHHLMFPENHGRTFAREVMERTTNDLVSVEQMLDVMTGRTFRQTLLVATERNAQIRRKITRESLAGLHYLPQADMRIERSGPETNLVDRAGRMLTTTRPVVARAMERIATAFPGTASFEDCISGCTTDIEREEVRDALLRLTVFGMVSPCAEPIVAARADARPRAFAVARSDMIAGLRQTVNLRHDSVMVDPASAEVLIAMDGRNSRRDIEARLLAAVREGRVRIGPNGAAEAAPAAQRKAVAEALPRILESLGICALIAP